MNTTPSSEMPEIVRQPDGRGAFWRIFWAGALILAGVILLAGQFNLLPTYGDVTAWDWVLLGGGGLLIVTEIVRSVAPDLGCPSGGRMILGLILAGLGAQAVFDLSFSLLWPVILIAIGLAVLWRNLITRT